MQLYFRIFELASASNVGLFFAGDCLVCGVSLS